MMNIRYNNKEIEKRHILQSQLWLRLLQDGYISYYSSVSIEESETKGVKETEEKTNNQYRFIFDYNGQKLDGTLIYIEIVNTTHETQLTGYILTEYRIGRVVTSRWDPKGYNHIWVREEP